MSIAFLLTSEGFGMLPLCVCFRYIIAELVGTEVEYVAKLKTLVEVI